MVTKSDIWDYVLCQKRMEILDEKLADIDREHFAEAYKLIGFNEVVDHRSFIRTATSISVHCDD